MAAADHLGRQFHEAPHGEWRESPKTWQDYDPDEGDPVEQMYEAQRAEEDNRPQR